MVDFINLKDNVVFHLLDMERKYCECYKMGNSFRRSLFECNTAI